MASAPGPRLDLVHKAICAGIWGNIEWSDFALRELANDPEMEGFTPAGIRQLLRQFVLDGNALDVRSEGFELWRQQRPDHPYWYRAVIPVPQFARGLFLYVILLDEDEEDEPFVQIVHTHRQR